MTESENEYAQKLTYLTQPRTQYSHLSNGDILDVDIEIFHEDDMDNVVFRARLDWQDGIHIWQTECVEPFLWPRIAELMTLALRDARKQITTPAYCCGEPL